MTESSSLTDVPALIVPGIGNSGPLHWQTIWEQQHPHWRRVQQRDWDHPDRDEWVGTLHTAIASMPAPVVLIAHSIGCLVVADCLRRSVGSVRAAFLVAVPDPHGPEFPAAARGFDSLPLEPLKTASLVIASHDDPFGSVAHARRCAAAWGSEFVDIGAAGHINAESNLRAWPQGFAFLGRLIERTGAPLIDSTGTGQ
jgi:predicted alpha/beta hydrolase family esterase